MSVQRWGSSVTCSSGKVGKVKNSQDAIEVCIANRNKGNPTFGIAFFDQ
jgi:hypothetical protein